MHRFGKKEIKWQSGDERRKDPVDKAPGIARS